MGMKGMMHSTVPNWFTWYMLLCMLFCACNIKLAVGHSAIVFTCLYLFRAMGTLKRLTVCQSNAGSDRDRQTLGCPCCPATVPRDHSSWEGLHRRMDQSSSYSPNLVKTHRKRLNIEVNLLSTKCSLLCTLYEYSMDFFFFTFIFLKLKCKFDKQNIFLMGQLADWVTDKYNFSLPHTAHKE